MSTPRFATSILIVSSLLAAGCSSSENGADPTAGPSTPAIASTPAVLVSEAASLQAVAQSSGQCSVMAPASWSVQASDSSGGMTALDPATEMGVQLTLVPVPRQPSVAVAMASPPWNDLRMYSADPRDVIAADMEFLLASAGQPSDFTFTSDAEQTVGGYTIALARTSKGYYRMMWLQAPGDGSALQYVLVIRIAAAPTAMWEAYGGMLAHIAASMRCTMQLSSQAGGSAASEVDTSTANDEGDDAGYNPWLGAEWVHDPTTGDNRLVTVKDWSDSGPDGAGYYGSNANGGFKYLPGRS